MKIQYQDEYFVELFNIDSDILPSKGSKVELDDTDYIVKDVVFKPQEGTVEVVLTETAPREIKESDNSDRLHTLEAAIFAVNKRQDDLHKKHRGLRDQVSNIRSNINQKAHSERKTQ